LSKFDDGAASYDSLLRSLPKDGEEKKRLEKLFTQRRDESKGVIRNSIAHDISHLEITNFSVEPFQVGSYLQSQTGYIFVRFEPLMGTGIKTFDVMIHNQDSRCTILVEEKSSVAEVGREAADLVKKIDANESKKDELEKLVGEISRLEFAVCTPPADSDKIFAEIRSRGVKSCVWSADLWTRKLLLRRMPDDGAKEVKLGQLHGDAELNSLMSAGARSAKGPVRLAPYLPSSHPVVILQDVTLHLAVEMEREGKSDFKLADVRTLLQREKAMMNMSDDEILKLALRVLSEGELIGIYEAEVGESVEVARKTYRITKKTTLPGLERFVESQYIDLRAEKRGKAKAAEDYMRERGAKYGSL